MKKNLVMLAVVGAISLQSCQKNPEDNCTPNTTSVAGSYMVAKITYRASAGAAEADYTNIVLDDVCERDDVLMLKANGTYQKKDDGTKCTPPGDDAGTWSINGAKIFMDGEEGDISYYNCWDKLEFIVKDVYVAGDQMKFFYVHQ